MAATLLAEIVAKLLLTSSGALAMVLLFGRIASLLISVAGYFVVQRSVVTGVVPRETTLIAIMWLIDR